MERTTAFLPAPTSKFSNNVENYNLDFRLWNQPAATVYTDWKSIYVVTYMAGWYTNTLYFDEAAILSLNY